MIDFDNLVAYRRNEHKTGIIPDGNRPLIPGQDANYRGRVYSLGLVETCRDRISRISAKNERKLAVNRAMAYESFISENADRLVGMVSVEWVGLKLQQTPGIDFDARVIAHADLNVKNFPDLKILRDFDELQTLFDHVILEGVIVVDPISGEYFKCRAEMMIENCAHCRAQQAWKAIKKTGRTELLIATLEAETHATFVNILTPELQT